MVVKDNNQIVKWANKNNPWAFQFINKLAFLNSTFAGSILSFHLETGSPTEMTSLVLEHVDYNFHLEGVLSSKYTDETHFTVCQIAK